MTKCSEELVKRIIIHTAGHTPRSAEMAMPSGIVCSEKIAPVSYCCITNNLNTPKQLFIISSNYLLSLMCLYKSGRAWLL